MKVRCLFAWYDLWVGAFVDRPKRRVYIFPLPCLGLVISWAEGLPEGQSESAATDTAPQPSDSLNVAERPGPGRA